LSGFLGEIGDEQRLEVVGRLPEEEILPGGQDGG
jgi:hypothetical protein